MNLNPFPEWAQHDRRLQHGLRAFCDNVATLVTAGHISPETAGRRLERLGVPFEDQCRIVREALLVRELCPEPEEFLELEATVCSRTSPASWPPPRRART